MQVNLSILILSFIILSEYYESSSAQFHCIKCDSTRERNCAVNPEDPNLNLTRCKECATSVVGKITYRGCHDEIFVGEYYKSCNRHICNDKIIPPGRKKCFQCNGLDCIKEQTGDAQACENFIEEDGCFTDVISETNTIRGCKSDNITLSANAIECPYNSCNNLNGIQKRTCLKCTDEISGCKRIIPKDPTKLCILDENTIENCTVEYLLGRPNETCFTYLQLNKVERGCTKLNTNLPMDEKYFSKCDDEKCNNKCLNATQCVVCNSSDDPNCKDNPNKIKLSICGPEDTTCYAKITDLKSGEIKRGCGTPLFLDNGYHCQGNGCNVKDIRKCYNCSSQDEPNCSNWINFNLIKHESCETPDDECIILINPDNFTVRGCKKSQLNCNSKISECKNCTGNLCNSDIFPESRIKCHQCQTTAKCDLNQNNKEKPLACQLYNSNDECIELMNSKNQMIRGCKSDSKLFDLCEIEKEKCRKCDSEGCNYREIFIKPKLSCFTCNDNNIPKGACAWTPKNDTIIKCKENVMFYNEETCYIHIDSNGLVSRGCSIDENIQKIYSINNDEKTDDKYQICYENGCNYIKTVNQSCLQCQSNITGMENCKTKAKEIKPTICEDKIQYFNKRGCFVTVNSDGVVKRGCSFKLTDKEFDICSKLKDKNCKYCQGDNCNSIQAPTFFGSSSKPYATTLWILIINFIIKIF